MLILPLNGKIISNFYSSLYFHVLSFICISVCVCAVYVYGTCMCGICSHMCIGS